jgi:hypothetical protein
VVGGMVMNSTISYAVNGKQYVMVFTGEGQSVTAGPLRIAALRTAKVDVRQATDGAYVRGFNNERPAIDEVPTPPSANC